MGVQYPAIDDLLSLVPPPASPVAADGNWTSVEESLGLCLPGDYKEFIRRYGAGIISNAIIVNNPFVRAVSAREFFMGAASIYESIARYGASVPYALYPDSPGLLPCASYLDLNHINWLADPATSDWAMVYYSRDFGFFDLGHISLTQFLVQVITGTTSLPFKVMDIQLTLRPNTFMPLRQRTRK